MEKAGPYIHDFQKQRQSPQRWARKGQVLSDCSFFVCAISLLIGNSLYSNVLFQLRGPQRRKALPVEGKVLDIPREDQKDLIFYWLSFP